MREAGTLLLSKGLPDRSVLCHQLLRHGANVYHTNRQKNKGTALHLAIANQLPNEIIQLLLKYRKPLAACSVLRCPIDSRFESSCGE